MPSREQEIARGHEADRILRSPIWEEAWASYEEKLLNAWKHSGSQDEQSREKIWVAYQVCQKVKNHVQSILTTGKLAMKQVEELNERTSSNP